LKIGLRKLPLTPLENHYREYLTDLVIGFYKFGEWLIFLLTYFEIGRKLNIYFAIRKKGDDLDKFFGWSGIRFCIFENWSQKITPDPLLEKPITDLTLAIRISYYAL
jgi:hypothetical protein